MSPDQIKAHIRAFYEEVVHKQDVNAVDRYFGASYVNHGPFPEPQVRTREELKGFFQALFTAFPDLHVTLGEMVVEGDLVAWRGIVSGTHQGELNGIPPTGKKVIAEEYHIERVRNGEMVEHWGLFDTLAMLQQIGAVPAQ
jgi:predicted ester cyclase